MSTINDGGPAFPITPPPTPAGQYSSGTYWPGISTRDYFAAKAMQGEIVCQGMEGSDIHHIAAMAYEAADAMIKARDARPPAEAAK